jgi:hypothetical protein
MIAKINRRQHSQQVFKIIEHIQIVWLSRFDQAVSCSTCLCSSDGIAEKPLTKAFCLIFVRFSIEE